MTMIGQGKERTRLQQLIDWCGGPDWDGPLIFDEASPLSSCPEQGGSIQYSVCYAVKVHGDDDGGVALLHVPDSCASLYSCQKGKSLLLLCGKRQTYSAAMRKC